jgi:hypothetical protein
MQQPILKLQIRIFKAFFDQICKDLEFIDSEFVAGSGENDTTELLYLGN